MLTRIGSRLVLVLLVGMAWLGSYNGCEIYGRVPALTGGVGFYDGAYVADNEVYYPVDPGAFDYVYDPYAGACDAACY
jgi:hypothetical protein